MIVPVAIKVPTGGFNSAEVESPEYLIFGFDKIARYDVDVLFELGGVLPSFDHKVLRGQIDHDTRDRLLKAVLLAHARAVSDLPEAIDRRVINDGMTAVAARVIAWAETPEQRKARPAGTFYRMACATRILRNDLHNYDLRQQIAESRAEACVAPAYRRAEIN